MGLPACDRIFIVRSALRQARHYQDWLEELTSQEGKPAEAGFIISSPRLPEIARPLGGVQARLPGV